MKIPQKQLLQRTLMCSSNLHQVAQLISTQLPYPSSMILCGAALFSVRKQDLEPCRQSIQGREQRQRQRWD